MDGAEEAILLTLCGQFDYSSYTRTRGIYIFGYDRKSSRNAATRRNGPNLLRNLFMLYIFLIFPSYSLLLLFVMLFFTDKNRER